MKEQELLNLKNKIEQSKASIAELKGRKKELLNTLKKDWGCKDLLEADRKIEDLESTIEDKKEERDKGLKELTEQFGL